MEWLRSVDLAEYAPNLRGSGVHGGLMVRKQAKTAAGTIPHVSVPNAPLLLLGSRATV